MDRSAITLDRIRTFVRVAEKGSLSAVARELHIGQSTVTRQLSELESALGVSLLHRTTRRVQPTEEGSRYYAQCIQILRLVEQSADEARLAGAAESGRIRVSATSALAILHLIRLISQFQDLHPQIEIDLNLTDDRLDLMKEGIDVSIRLGPLTDSGAKLRSLGVSDRILVASGAYLDRFGRPQEPCDLAMHQVIRMSNIAGSETLLMRSLDGTASEVRIGGRLLVDHGLAAREALVLGRGIAPAHRWLVGDLLAQGQLERVLPDHGLEPVPLSLLIGPSRSELARVRLLIDYLVEEITRLPGVRP